MTPLPKFNQNANFINFQNFTVNSFQKQKILKKIKKFLKKVLTNASGCGIMITEIKEKRK